mmetsp:Transcript_234/g.447  ORF Transcript_234/g.447 Transcript_234/m.447 type:complete len:244 (-) Transcript_234:2378-3109(-)
MSPCARSLSQRSHRSFSLSTSPAPCTQVAFPQTPSSHESSRLRELLRKGSVRCSLSCCSRFCCSRFCSIFSSSSLSFSSSFSKWHKCFALYSCKSSRIASKSTASHDFFSCFLITPISLSESRSLKENNLDVIPLCFDGGGFLSIERLHSAPSPSAKSACNTDACPLQAASSNVFTLETSSRPLATLYVADPTSLLGLPSLVDPAFSSRFAKFGFLPITARCNAVTSMTPTNVIPFAQRSPLK